MNQVKTDWDRYYEKPYKTASFSRPITIKHVLGYLKKYAPKDRPFTITEFGGGNSCFYETFANELKPQTYYIVDNNQTGLDAFRSRIGEREDTVLLNRDIMDCKADWQSDVVYSVGLIEHFLAPDTRKAVLAHLQVLKPGGLLILGFPTPTFLYRITRKMAEILGLWIFHDERPLKREEVLETVKPYGSVLESDILWPIFLTQAFIVLKKFNHEGHEEEERKRRKR
jgi:SAM-dependent methyltransferase